jgi:Flp pilus assembly protein TadG
VIALAPFTARSSALRQPRRGQTLIIFALSLTVLMGALGLALDGGYNYAQRRAMQNAADAAALAGTKALAGNNNNTNGLTVWSTVKTIAEQNGVRSPNDSARLTCVYLNNSLQPLSNPASCHDTPFDIGTNVSAVRVRVTEEHTTFVMRVLGINTSGTAATATAQVLAVTELPNKYAPYVPCGIGTKIVENGNNINPQVLPATVDILKATKAPAGPSPNEPGYTYSVNASPAYYRQSYQDSPLAGWAQFNPEAYSYLWNGDSAANIPANRPPAQPAGPNQYRFLIHKGSGSSGPERCTANSSSFKGINTNLDAGGTIKLDRTLFSLTGSTPYASVSGVYGPSANQLGYSTGMGDIILAGQGTGAGPAANVPGAGGCTAGQANNCILVLPVVDNSIVSSGGGQNNYLAVRQFAAFYMTSSLNPNGTVQGDEHWGYLVKDYPIDARGSATWTPGFGGATTIRLVQ